MPEPIAIIGLNLGGPDSLDAVQPFLRNLFNDPDVIQLGWARPLQPLLASAIARRRAPVARRAYAEIGGRSPILEQSRAQIAEVARALGSTGIDARPFVAMACWPPLATETVASIRAQRIRRAIALPLYPQYSRTTTGSSLKALARATDAANDAAGNETSPGVGNPEGRGAVKLEIEAVRGYPIASGFIEAVCQTLDEAVATLPPALADSAPILFSAHGLPTSYIRRGDPYLDEVRSSVAAVTRRLNEQSNARPGGPRTLLAFQSRVGRQRWLEPSTEQVLDDLAAEGAQAVVVCPIAFTGEHVETLQELDLVYRRRALERGLTHFARARTVGTHPAFIAALAHLCGQAARRRGWS